MLVVEFRYPKHKCVSIFKEANKLGSIFACNQCLILVAFLWPKRHDDKHTQLNYDYV